MTVTEAVAELSAESGRPDPPCRRALRDLLLVSSVPERERTLNPDASEQGFFAFKLHQFISGAGHAYATIEPPGARKVTVEGQQFLPGHAEKRLYAVHFCRECGHEYHPVRLVQRQDGPIFLARDIDDAPPTRKEEAARGSRDAPPEGEFGFLTPHPPGDSAFGFADREDELPRELAGARRQRPDENQEVLPRRARSQLRGSRPTDGSARGAKAWFLPGKFRLCLRCGNTQGGAARDRTRLASLSAEGRSSATTVLVGSALRWMHGAESELDLHTRKLLGFTDNRQDAALQAGHFNDFVFVSLACARDSWELCGMPARTGFAATRWALPSNVRSASIEADPTDSRRVAARTQPARLQHCRRPEGTLRQVLTYRIWFDQRRGWRYTNPNLEQLGMVRVEYLGVEGTCCGRRAVRRLAPAAQAGWPRGSVRRSTERCSTTCGGGWRFGARFSITATLEQLVAKSHSRLRLPLGAGPRRKAERAPAWLMIVAPRRRAGTLRDMDLIVRGGSRSGLGRKLRSTDLWDGDGSIRDLKSKEVDRLIEDLLRAAATHGLVSEESTPFDQPGWRLNDACVLFRAGDANADGSGSGRNAFFRDLYENLATMLRTPTHPLFGFEGARAHRPGRPGQPGDSGRSVFRFGDREREELETRRPAPQRGWRSQSLPAGAVLFPYDGTRRRHRDAERGSHAQRTAHAGELRSAGADGQDAADRRPWFSRTPSSQSPHDQYFFRDPKAMVHGEVRAPILELANRDLIDSHLQAVWLSCVDQPLDPSHRGVACPCRREPSGRSGCRVGAHGRPRRGTRGPSGFGTSSIWWRTT